MQNNKTWSRFSRPFLILLSMLFPPCAIVVTIKGMDNIANASLLDDRKLIQHMSGAIALFSFLALLITFALLPGAFISNSGLITAFLLGIVFFVLYMLLPAIYLNETLMMISDGVYIALITYIATQGGQYGILILFLYFIIITADALKYPLSEYVVVVLITIQAAFLYILLWSPFEAQAKIGILALFIFSIASMGIFMWYFSSRIIREQSLRAVLEKKSKYLKTLNAHLEAVDHMRTNVLNVASHEFQTPLSIIKNSLSILRQDAKSLTPQQLKYIQTAASSNERIIRLVKDLLSTSRVQSGEWKLVLKETDMAQLINEIASEYKSICDNAKLKLVVNLPKNPVTLYIDKNLIHVAFKNLVENATRYTKAGGTVALTLDAHEDEVLLSVTDTGIGMSPTEMKHLFTQFSRSDNAILTKPDGFGIGLYYSRIIVRRHKGDIKVRSTEGKGSTFTIHLPIQKAALSHKEGGHSGKRSS